MKIRVFAWNFIHLRENKRTFDIDWIASIEEIQDVSKWEGENPLRMGRGPLSRRLNF